MDPKHILEQFESANWQKMTANNLRAFIKSLDLQADFGGKNIDLLTNSVETYLAHCRFALKHNLSPNPTSPPAAKEDKSPEPVPTMAALDDAVSPTQDTKPADNIMGTQDAVVRDGTPPPQVDNSQTQPEPVKEEDSLDPAMERFTPVHVTIALDRRLSDMEKNHKSLLAAYFEHVHQVSVFSKQVEPRLCALENEQNSTDICVRELQDQFDARQAADISVRELPAQFQVLKADCQQDLASLRRDVYRAERQVRADNVQAAQLGPQGEGADQKAIMALKMAGKSPISLSHFSKIGVDTKISRVGMASVAFTELEAELETWEGTVYGLDRANHRPLCNLLRSRLPPELVTSILYASLDAAPRLQAADTYAEFKDALLQVLIQLDLGTSSHLDFIQKQRQGPRTITQHITVLRAFTDTIPSDVQNTQDFRKALFYTFNYRVHQHLAQLNADWKTKNRYPDATALYKAACEADRFFDDVDEVDEGEIHSTPRVLAIQNSPLTSKVWNIDQHLLHDLYPEGRGWGPDYALDPEPCFQQEEYLCGALMEVNKLDITNAPDLQICLRTVAKCLDQLSNGTWPARGFSNATSRAAHNVQAKVDRQQQGLCWNCGEPGHLKAQCPKPHKRLTDHR
jgi:hypothetical protein